MSRSEYNLCDGTGLVCENHPSLAWAGASDGPCTCDCGPGMPCAGCISCDMGFRAETLTPTNGPRAAPTPPRVSGVIRDAFDEHDVVVCFSRKLTDDELRRFHDFTRNFRGEA